MNRTSEATICNMLAAIFGNILVPDEPKGVVSGSQSFSVVAGADLVGVVTLLKVFLTERIMK